MRAGAACVPHLAGANLLRARADSADYLGGAQPEPCECPCGSGTFEVIVGVSLYTGSEDVRWLYVGCRCPACGLTACYGHWKNQHPGYADLLALV